LGRWAEVGGAEPVVSDHAGFVGVGEGACFEVGHLVEGAA